jgi:hypothetical protein
VSWDVKWLAAAGRFAEAEDQAREARRWSEKARTSYGTSLFAGQIFGLRRDQGRLEELLPIVERLMGGDPTLSAWRGGMLLARIQAGDAERAQAELSALAEHDFTSIRRDLFWSPPSACSARPRRSWATPPRQPALHARLAPHAARTAQAGLAFFLGPVELFLGQLAATSAATPRLSAGSPRRGAQRRARAPHRRGPCPLRARGAPARPRRRGPGRPRGLEAAAAEARTLGMDAIAAARRRHSGVPASPGRRAPTRRRRARADPPARGRRLHAGAALGRAAAPVRRRAARFHLRSRTSGSCADR